MTKKLVIIPNYVSLFFVFFKFCGCSLLLGLFFSACQPNNQEAKNILSPEKMSSILTDLHLAEAYILESRYRNEDTARVAYTQLEKEVFKKYKTDSLTYAKSYRFYARNVTELNEIYNAVVDTLSYRESVAKAKEQKKDSLQNKKKFKFTRGKDSTNRDMSPKMIREKKTLDSQ